MDQMKFEYIQPTKKEKEIGPLKKTENVKETGSLKKKKEKYTR